MPSRDKNAFTEAFSPMILINSQIIANVKYDAYQRQWQAAQQQQFGIYQTLPDFQPASTPQRTQPQDNSASMETSGTIPQITIHEEADTSSQGIMEASTTIPLATHEEVDTSSPKYNTFVEAFSSMDLANGQIVANVKYDAYQRQWQAAQQQQFGIYQTLPDFQPASTPQRTQLTNQQQAQGQGSLRK
ncbi:hypothetical protein OHA02_52000 [Streptomyces phaeochromogenes]|nr:hypothetical protein [Streptomyces phaeochromogenes]